MERKAGRVEGDLQTCVAREEAVSARVSGVEAAMKMDGAAKAKDDSELAAAVKILQVQAADDSLAKGLGEQLSSMREHVKEWVNPKP